jgi:predicted dehydrogenase
VVEKPLRVGLIGVGSVAQVAHIPAWLRLKSQAQLVVACDEDKARLHAVAGRFGIPETVTDFEEVLRDESVDAVDICAPNHLHAPIAIAALRAGKDVLCERPLARNSSEAESMVRAAESSGRMLMCAMNNRFRADAQVLRAAIQKREIGDIFYMKCGWLRRGTTYGWKAERALSGGGAVLDLGVQMLDLALWLAGSRQVETVSAQVHRQRPDAVENAAVAMLRLAGGGVITMEVSWSLSIEKDIAYLHAFGGRGAAVLNPLKVLKEMHGDLKNVTPAIESPVRNLYQQSYQREIEHFVACIRRGETPISPGVDGLQVMRIADAIYASARSGREVALNSGSSS